MLLHLSDLSVKREDSKRRCTSLTRRSSSLSPYSTFRNKRLESVGNPFTDSPMLHPPLSPTGSPQRSHSLYLLPDPLLSLVHCIWDLDLEFYQEGDREKYAVIASTMQITLWSSPGQHVPKFQLLRRLAVLGLMTVLGDTSEIFELSSALMAMSHLLRSQQSRDSWT